ncbi:tetratricopeptide repeat protein [Kitasatospora sp. NPDC001664]
MERARVVGVTGLGGPGSGYAVGGRLVLTSAHVVARAGERVQVFRPGGAGRVGGRVVWCGTPGGRDDAALVLLDDDSAWQAPGAVVRWGRMATDKPGTGCRTWGVPDVAQRAGQPVEAAQLAGTVNPGTGFAGNQYVMDLLQHPPQWSEEGTSPWGGMSGAAVFCDRMLAGVVASDREHSGHGQLNVVPAYVLHHDPAFRAALAEHGAGASGLEAVELQYLAEVEPAGRGEAPGSPAALLQASRQTVPFHGRQGLLASLRDWCGRDGFGAWLLHGPGGQGKTRLAHHLAALLAADGWAVLWPRADATAAELRELREVVKPLLVVLDYAEARTGQLTALIVAAAHHPDTTPFKVLLLARTDGDWWTQAKSATRLTDNYLDGAPSMLLEPLEQDPGPRPQAYRTAARALADALPDVKGMAGHDWRSAADTLPTPGLDHDAFANALTLQMTALADLLDTTTPAGPGTPPVPAEQVHGVEDRLLGHERRYWQHGATVHGLTPTPSRSTLETALAAAHLVGAADNEHADRTWSRIPALADQPRDRRDAVTAWITALYPATAPGRPWGALQPDRLAERHIGRVLAADPHLAERLIDGTDAAQAAQLLTVYSRAAAHPIFDGRLDTHLTALCVRHHDWLAPHIIATAVQVDHPRPLITALDTLATDPTTALGDLTTLHDRLPHSSRRLACTASQLAEAITNRYRTLVVASPDAYLPDLAGALNNLSNRLAEVGRRAEALAVCEEAARHYRTLVSASPDAYLPDLAMALNNLSVRLGEVGRRAEALAVSEEAGRHYRTLAVASPDAYLPDLARALNNLSNRLGEVGRRAEAMAASEEAVTIRRTLVEASPDAYLPDLAGALNNLSNRLAEVGRWEEALAVCEEAVTIHRTLAVASPDAYLPDLARALNNLSNRLGEVGRRAEGLAASEEAARHYRTLVVASPDAYLPDLAGALNNLSVDLGEVGRWEEALAVCEEAVTIHRTLAVASPDAYLPDLARALNNLSVRLGEVGRREEGLAASEEAVTIRRTLVEVSPDAYLPDLAGALNNLSVRLGAVGRREEGLAVSEEAGRHYRTLAVASPDAYLPNLARALNTLSVRLGEVGRWEEALAVSEEAARHYRTLVEASPDAYLPDLARALNNLSVRLGAVGRREEGLVASEEAARHYRTLVEASPDAYLPDLARALNNLSVDLGEVGRRAEALAVCEEAVRHYRTLVVASPDAYLPNLAGALNNLSVDLGEVGRWEEALAVCEEAARHYRTLVVASPDAYLPDLAMALNNLSVRLGAVGRWAEGLVASEEAARHYRTLVEASPDAYLPDLAGALNNLSVRLAEVGRWAEGLAVSEEAVTIHRPLAEANPERFDAALRKSLEIAALFRSLPE